LHEIVIDEEPRLAESPLNSFEEEALLMNESCRRDTTLALYLTGVGVWQFPQFVLLMVDAPAFVECELQKVEETDCDPRRPFDEGE
jgi:hypothetical protein